MIRTFGYFEFSKLFRYNIERFSNNLPRAARIKSLEEPIAEGYFPKLDSVIAARIWAPRQANAKLSVKQIIFQHNIIYS